MPNTLTDKYILSELEKIKYLYGINKVIRFNLKRKEKYQTQSVAEHVANMIYLAYYFRKYEDPANKLDFDKVIKIILFHDLGEIETGDIPTSIKNDNDRNAEKVAMRSVKTKSPKFIADEIDLLYKEFKDPKTREGQYAKSIDKLEGQMFGMEKHGVKMLIRIHKSLGLRTKITHPIYMKKVFAMLDKYRFPIIKRFTEVIDKKMYSYGIIE